MANPHEMHCATRHVTGANCDCATPFLSRPEPKCQHHRGLDCDCGCDQHPLMGELLQRPSDVGKYLPYPAPRQPSHDLTALLADILERQQAALTAQADLMRKLEDLITILNLTGRT